jgi:hypothetical protein
MWVWFLNRLSRSLQHSQLGMVDQDRTCTTYMSVYLVIFCTKYRTNTTYTHIYMCVCVCGHGQYSHLGCTSMLLCSCLALPFKMVAPLFQPVNNCEQASGLGDVHLCADTYKVNNCEQASALGDVHLCADTSKVNNCEQASALGDVHLCADTYTVYHLITGTPN